MCHNHSHAEAENLGVTSALPGAALILRVTQPFAVNLTTGERLTLPSGSLVVVPCAQKETLSRLAPQVMGGRFICSSLRVESELTFIPIPASNSTRSVPTGLSAASEAGPTTLPLMEVDDVPF